MTAISSGQAVPASSTTLRGASRAPRTVANKAANSSVPRGGPRGASGAPKASETAGIAKGRRSTQSTQSKPSTPSGAA